MSWFSRAIGSDSRRNRLNSALGDVDQQIATERSGTGFQDAFNKTAGSFLQNALPGFQKSLQLTREDGIRRGISTGDLGTSNEGDLASAFQRNIANALGGLAMQGYEGSQNRLMELLSGKLSGAQDAENSSSNFWSSILGSGIGAAGLILA